MNGYKQGTLKFAQDCKNLDEDDDSVFDKSHILSHISLAGFICNVFAQSSFTVIVFYEA